MGNQISHGAPALEQSLRLPGRPNISSLVLDLVKWWWEEGIVWAEDHGSWGRDTGGGDLLQGALNSQHGIISIF